MLVIAGVDPDHGSNVAAEAAKLADAFDADLQLLHVTESDEFAEQERDAARKGERLASVAELEDEAATVAEEAGAEIDRPFEPVGRVGEPEKVLVAAAEENEADYLVVGGRRRTPVGKAVFGSVTQSVILNSEISVLCVQLEE